MTQKQTAFGNFTIHTSAPRRSAEAKGMRRALALAILAATVFAGSALLQASQSAAMQLDGAKGDRPYVLAYAEPLADRFAGMLDGVSLQAADEEHELNDAWMGMSVVSRDGVALGYVTDAFVNEDGSIDELVVTPVDGQGPLATPVYVPANLAELGAETIALTLTAKVAAALMPATDLDGQVATLGR